MKILNIIFSVLLVLTYSYFSYLLFDIGLLSGKYGIILFIILAIIILLIIIGIIKGKKICKIISYIFYVIFLLIFIVGIYYLNTTIAFIDSFGKKDKTDYDNYYVVVLKNSRYLKLKDLNNKKIGMCKTLDSNVLKNIKISFDSKEYEECESLKEAFYEKKVDALILSDVDEFLLNNIDSLFEENVRVIHTIKIRKENTKEKENENVNVSKTPFTVFISGIDTYGAISKVSRSDVNIIATVNPISNEVLLTTIPRDYYVQLDGTTGYKDKLTHAGIYGIDKSVKTIENLLNTKINYYVRVNFDSVVKLVDEIGGVNIYSDRNLKFCDIKQGYNYLDGKCALRFARERHSYETGDRHRGENQEEVIRAIIEKVSKSNTILTKYNTILTNLQNSFESNVSPKTIKDYIKMQIKDMPSWNVKNLNLNGYDSHNYTYSYKGSKLYVMEPDYNTVNKAKKIINGMLNKKTFSELGI